MLRDCGASAEAGERRRTFKITKRTGGRYVLIWFTRLPPAGPGRFQAEIFSIAVRGWR